MIRSTAARIQPLESEGPRLRVLCPSCQQPILLAAWWSHGCPRALVDREVVLGTWDDVVGRPS